jgi:hypothetical protein
MYIIYQWINQWSYIHSMTYTTDLEIQLELTYEAKGQWTLSVGDIDLS